MLFVFKCNPIPIYTLVVAKHSLLDALFECHFVLYRFHPHRLWGGLNGFDLVDYFFHWNGKSPYSSTGNGEGVDSTCLAFAPPTTSSNFQRLLLP